MIYGQKWGIKSTILWWHDVGYGGVTVEYIESLYSQQYYTTIQLILHFCCSENCGFNHEIKIWQVTGKLGNIYYTGKHFEQRDNPGGQGLM